jgi:hypothetical protein
MKGHLQIIFVVARYIWTREGGQQKKRRINKNNKRRAISERSARSAKGLSRIRVRWGGI